MSSTHPQFELALAVLDVAPDSPGVEESAVCLETGEHDVAEQVTEVGLRRPHRGEPTVQVTAQLTQTLFNLGLL